RHGDWRFHQHRGRGPAGRRDAPSRRDGRLPNGLARTITTGEEGDRLPDAGGDGGIELQDRDVVGDDELIRRPAWIDGDRRHPLTVVRTGGVEPVDLSYHHREGTQREEGPGPAVDRAVGGSQDMGRTDQAAGAEAAGAVAARGA